MYGNLHIHTEVRLVQCFIPHVFMWFEGCLMWRKEKCPPSPFVCLVLFWVRPAAAAKPSQIPPRLPVTLANVVRIAPRTTTPKPQHCCRHHSRKDRIREPLISYGGSFAMRNARAGLEAVLGLVAPLMAGGACLQNSLSIDTTTLTSSGCYQQSMYAGLYETLVWTIDGRDVAPTGTKAISASHVSSCYRQEYAWVTLPNIPRRARISHCFQNNTQTHKGIDGPARLHPPYAVCQLVA